MTQSWKLPIRYKAEFDIQHEKSLGLSISTLPAEAFLFDEKERTLQKSCKVFIVYTQAVALRQFQTRAKSRSHS